MRVIDPGHHYILNGVGGAPDNRQQLVFVKNRGEKYPGNEGEPHGGVLVQEVLRVLIDRTAYLDGQGKCAETAYALNALRQALAWFEYRAARCRGDVIDNEYIDDLELQETCSICGHTNCTRGDDHERLPGTYR